ncbi:MAG: enoyl-CoA hydratase [Planctomycetota bacterium]
MPNFLRLTQDGALATIAFAREKGLNILSSEVLNELEAAWKELEAGGRARVCILHGDGKVFLAGADIKEMAQLDVSGAQRFAERGQRLFDAIESSGIVSIAALHGAALGGGCELALACDIRLAAAGTKLGQPEVNLGLIPGFGGSQRLPRVVGLGPALHLILSGEAISAEDALRLGLVTQVLPPEQLLDTARKLAQTVLAKGPGAVRLAKRATREALQKPQSEGMPLEAQAFAACFKDGEAQEGMAAFVEKRPANFKHA